MASTHEYLLCVNTSNPSLCHQPHLSNLKKKKRNLPGKPTKSLRPMKTTTNYHQYFLGTIIEREKKKKNLPKTPTKTGKLTTKTNYQLGNGKKPTKKKEKGKKKI
ncbi:hypothetical protein G9A89_011275 [Geosiphon pyriformis]|nr:hypothetical protein G9A89_011275 [Geosiphon pyriformis]